MAGSVYQTKLTADTTQHDQALGRSAKQVYNYKKEVDKANADVDKLGKSFSKLAGALGLTTIAVGTFKSALRQNAELADRWGQSMQVLKTAAGDFVYSLSTMDFSNFFNGLGDIITRSHEAYNALDNLATLQAQISGRNSKLQADYEESFRRLKAGDRSAADDMRRLAAEMDKNNQAVIDARRTSMMNTVRLNTTSTGFGGGSRLTGVKPYEYKFEFSDSQLDDLAELVMNTDKLNSKVKQLEVTYKAAEERASEYNKQNQAWYDVAKAKAEWEAYQKLQKRYGDPADEGSAGQQFLDDWTTNQNQRQQENAFQRMTEVRINAALNKAEGPESTRTDTDKADEILPPGSIAEVEKRLKTLHDAYNLATEDGGEKGRHALLQQIHTAEAELKKMKIDPSDLLPEGSLAKMEARLKELKERFSNAATDAERDKIRKDIKTLENDLKKINGEVTITVKTRRQQINEEIQRLQEQMENTYFEIDMKVKKGDLDGLQALIDSLAADGSKIDELTGSISRLGEATMTPSEKIQEQIKGMGDAYRGWGEIGASSADAIANAFLALSNTEDEVASHNLKTMATLTGQIGSVIPKILALVAANQAEALSSGIAGAAKVPFPGNLPAMAAIVAEIVAMFATVSQFKSRAQSFAGGGIFEGMGSKFGDMHIARVNPGEMILNPRQQRNLFGLLDGNLNIGGNNNVGGDVTFKISGSTLVGVLSNYNRTTERRK